ncbi:MAG TPA: dienelactone hydrolase family protein, partial [Reyranella sp.]|nr:dienelactone hydrolase family protein [Reyranella sp.]
TPSRQRSRRGGGFGWSSPLNYRDVAHRIGALGYDVVLFDSRIWIPTQARGLRDAIAQAQRMPHALPGKVGLVGFSLGGGYVLGYGTAWSDQVAVVAAWYPSTTAFKDPPAWAGRVRVPTVMFAGENDTYHNCCLIDKARAIGKAAQAAGAPFELTTYPNTPHGFNLLGANYKAQASSDAFARTEVALKKNMN